MNQSASDTLALIARLGTVVLIPMLAWALSMLVTINSDVAVFHAKFEAMEKQQADNDAKMRSITVLYNTLATSVAVMKSKQDADK